jgi:cysteine desulfurase
MLPTAASAKTIYMDYAATTPTDPEVLKLMLPYFSADYNNPSSLHGSGRRAHQVIQTCRAKIANIIGALPSEIIFTGSGTEADNLALIGVAKAYREYGNHIIISAIEHKAVLEAAETLENEGFRVSIAPVLPDGLIDISACLALITPDTTLISVMYANNEVGTVEPIAELSAALAAHRTSRGLPLLHTDACQAAGYLPLSVVDLGVDLMTINSSKIYGPKGVGALYKKRSTQITPQLVGGEQEMKLRAGTESLPLIVGFTEALIKAEASRPAEVARLTELRDYFIVGLEKAIPQVIINGHRTKRLPNNVHVSLPNIEGESILLMLDQQHIEVGTGSACSAFDLKPSHVLLALGTAAETAHGSIRFSLGKYSTKEEIDAVLSVFPAIVKNLTAISALTVQATKIKYDKPK